MNEPTLLTVGQIYPEANGSVVIFDGEQEIAAVFGSPKIAGLRAAELISGANVLRKLRASRVRRVNVTITKGKVKQ